MGVAAATHTALYDIELEQEDFRSDNRKIDKE